VESNEGKNLVFHPNQLVVAIGENTTPRIPQFEGASSFKGVMFHSSNYTSGESMRGKKALIVGFGNSGCEIAIDLWEHDAKPSILLRSPVNIIPRILSQVVQDVFDKYTKRPGSYTLVDGVFGALLTRMYGDLKQFGITTPNPADPVITSLVLKHHPPVIDVGTVDLIRKGEVQVICSEIDRLTESGVLFKDGKEQPFDVIICATGFHFNAAFAKFLNESVVKKVVNEHHVVVSGNESPQENLYFVGHCDYAGRLREIRLEALRIASHIAGKVKKSGSK